MTFRRRQLLGWSLLVLAALLGGGWLARLDYGRKITTDVLDLVPPDDAAPELALVRSLASQAEARAMFFALTLPGGQPAPVGAARRFVEELRKSPAFDQAVVIGDTSTREELGRALFERRFTLLFPLWLEDRTRKYATSGAVPGDFSSWLARDAAGNLSQFVTKPEALAFQDIVPADPLLLLPDTVDSLKHSLLVASATSSGATTLVWARLSASPLSEAGQNPAFNAILQATAGVRAEFPGFAVADTGVNRFAAASRARIEKEVTWINLLSFAAVLAVAFTFIRDVHRGLHLVPVVLMSILGAWVGVTLAFERLHILVFVIGSLLTGVAIDYGFYLFMQPPARPDEDYVGKVRRLAKPLVASCLTAVAGFALLLFSDLPFIRQLGVFVGTGLVCALLAAVTYFATVRNPYLATRDYRGAAGLPAGVRRSIRRGLVVAWLAMLPGLAFLTWKDDIRELDIPSPDLKREHARITGLFGESEAQTVYLTFGASIDEARASVDQLEAWLETAGSSHAVTMGLSSVVPTKEAYAKALDFNRDHPEFPSKFRAALAEAGFDEEGFAPFFAAYNRGLAEGKPEDLDEAIAALQSHLVGPAGMLLHIGRPLNWFVTLARRAPTSVPPPATHTISASQLESLNGIFRHYRQSALRLSLIGLGLVGLGVLLTYGWRDGLRIFAIPCGACLGIFGLFGWIGLPLNLFHLLGAFLGVCLTHNYSIFSATSAYLHEPPPIAVRLSALTAAASFGVLALSTIPVVRALGQTVAVMVLAALLVIEFEHLSALGKKS